VRTRQSNLYLAANYDAKRFDNELNATTTTRYKSDVLSLGLSTNSYDGFAGGGLTSASLTYSGGQLNLDGSPNQSADAATTQTAGSFTKLRYTLSRQQTLTATLALRAALSGQAATKNLDSSESFYLGGPTGVRAYPANEGGGADGSLVNLELLWRLAQSFTLGGFYDYGVVQVNHNNDYTGALVLNSYQLKGAGLALAWQGPRGTALKATWARRIGDNPNPTTAGNDQDGSLVRDRFWLEATLTF
jgi:hemolysin activation/secretion protein